MPRPVFEMNSRIVGEELTDLRPDDAPAYAVSPRFRYERKTPVKLTRLNQMLAERRKINQEKVSTSVVTTSNQKTRIQPLSISACIESRPPLPFDLSGPTPFTYSPSDKLPHKRNAPSFSIGRLIKPSRGNQEKSTIGREWSSYADVWTIKTDFSSETWPSSANIALPSTIGVSQANYQSSPAISISPRRIFSTVKACADKEPSPSKYHTGLNLDCRLQRAPAYAFGTDKGKSIWLPKDRTPGPGTYMPQVEACKPSSPAYSIRGVRGAVF